jgi:hypothetical protein
MQIIRGAVMLRRRKRGRLASALLMSLILLRRKNEVRQR